MNCGWSRSGDAEGTPSERDDLPQRHRGHRAGLIDNGDRNGAADGNGTRGGNGRGRRRVGFFATFTADDSRRGTRGQLVEGTVEVQLN